MDNKIKTKYMPPGSMSRKPFMGILVKDDGTCEFSGRTPTEEEREKYMAQAKELAKKRKETDMKNIEECTKIMRGSLFDRFIEHPLGQLFTFIIIWCVCFFGLLWILSLFY